MKHSIVVVDDHLLIAKAISAIINQFSNFHVMYEVENGSLLDEKFKLKSNIPEIILLDISMPVMDGFETAIWLRENYPQVLVMALSVQDDENSLLRMVRNGAKGYLVKNTHPRQLEEALNALIEHKLYFPEWANKMFLNAIKGESSFHDEVKMSDRETEFMKHVCSEMSYKEISEIMYCSPRTIEGYRDALFEKFGVRTRVGLAVVAIKLGICKV